MDEYRIILMVVGAVFFGVLTSVRAAEVRARPPHLIDSSVPGDNIIGERSSQDANNTYEERAGGIASKLSSLAENFADKNRLAVQWADAQKSDDFVQGKLKLSGLTGNSLREHTNYKFFEKFVRTKQLNQLSAWHETKTSTSAVWRELGLENTKTWDDLIKAVDTDAFKLYQRYAESFDSRVVNNVVLGTKPMPVVSSDTFWAERIARLVRWKVKSRTEEYAMVALGLNRFPPAALETNNNGKAFMLFWLLKTDNSINGAHQNTKDIVMKVKELESMSPTQLMTLKSKDSLDSAQQNTRDLFKRMLNLKNVPRAKIEANDKYQTYKYLYGLIKKQTNKGYTSTLLEPRLRW